MLFYPEVSNVYDPYESLYSYQPDAYRLAALKRQRVEQARRQREAEERERQRQVQEILYRRQLEQEEARRLALQRQQQAQLRRQQELQAASDARARARNSMHARQQSVHEDSADEDEVEYVRHPFFGLVPRRRQRRARPQAPVKEQAERTSRNHSIPVQFSYEPDVAVNTPAPEPRSSTTLEPIALDADAQRRRTDAAMVIQKRWRAHSQRKQALRRIASVRASFDTLRSSFTFPEVADFDHDASSSDSPILAFTPNNKPIHAYEHAALQLLTVLDAVESSGDALVRKARKALVNEIESALRVLEEQKAEAWRKQHSSSSIDIPTHEFSSQLDEAMEIVAGDDSAPVNAVGLDNIPAERDHEEDEDNDEEWVDAADQVLEEEIEVKDLATDSVDDEFDATVVDALLPTA